MKITGRIKERLTLSDFSPTLYGPSVISPGATQLLGEWYACPACGDIQPEMDHLETRTCVCGLVAHAAGNSLVIF